MAILEHVEVRIKEANSDTYLPEYNPPGAQAPSTPFVRIEKYIEAQTDQQFEIEITVHPEFDFHGAAGIVVRILIDGGFSPVAPCYIQKPNWAGNSQTIRRTLSQAMFKSTAGFYLSSFSFGSIAIDEGLDSNADELAIQCRSLGTLLISFQRFSAVQITHHEDPNEPLANDQPLVTEGSKELVKDARISHSFKPCNETPIDAPRYAARAFYLPNEHGNPRIFHFRYRSKYALNVLNILEMSPAPEPIDGCETTEVQGGPEEPEEPEVQESRAPREMAEEESSLAPFLTREAIQAALARLESENEALRKKIKQEEIEIKTEPYSRRLSDFQPADGGSPRKRRKVIDLTGDD